MIKVKLFDNDSIVLDKTFDKRSVSIGRSADCDIVVDDPLVSPVHASAKLKKGRLKLVDEGSVNGIWNNNKRLSKRKFNKEVELYIAKKIKLSLDFEDEQWLTQKHNNREKIVYFLKTFDPRRYVKELLYIFCALVLFLVAFKMINKFKISRLKGSQKKVYDIAFLDEQAKKLLSRGKKYYFNGEYVRAAGEFSKVLQRYPSNEDALNYSKQIKSDFAPQIEAQFMNYVDHSEYDKAAEFLDGVKSVLGHKDNVFYRKILKGQKALVNAENEFRKARYESALETVKNVTVLDQKRLERIRLYSKSAIEFKEKVLVVNSMLHNLQYNAALEYLDGLYQTYKDLLADELKKKYKKQYRLIMSLEKMHRALENGYKSLFLIQFKKTSSEFGMTNPAIVSYAVKAKEIERNILNNYDSLKIDALNNIKRIYVQLQAESSDNEDWRTYSIYLSKLELYQEIKFDSSFANELNDYGNFHDAYVRKLYDEAYVLESFGELDHARQIYEQIMFFVNRGSKFYNKVEAKLKKYR